MSTQTFSFPEWLNANSMRAYPLSASGSRRSQVGSIKIPNSLIVDFTINLPASRAGATVFVSRLEVLPSRISITVSLDESGTVTRLSTVRCDIAEHTQNQSYPFLGTGSDSSIVGVLTIGETNETLAEFQGAFNFDSDSSFLEATTLSVSQPMLEYVSIVEKDQEIARFNSTLRLRSGGNIRLTRLDDNSIRIDGISGENLDDCPVDPIPGPIRTINGTPPDENGNLNISGSECISVAVVSASTLEIRDLCSSSCCGCQELEALIESIRELDTQQANIRDVVYRAYAEQATMISTLTSFLRS